MCALTQLLIENLFSQANNFVLFLLKHNKLYMYGVCLYDVIY